MKIPVHVPLGVKSERHARKQQASRTHKTTKQSGHSGPWRRMAKAHLLANPMCVHCAERGIRKPARHCDHVDANPMAYNPRLQSLCIECHSRKTALEDGGFGRPRRK